jgi:hypothetical protein
VEGARVVVIVVKASERVCEVSGRNAATAAMRACVRAQARATTPPAHTSCRACLAPPMGSQAAGPPPPPSRLSPWSTRSRLMAMACVARCTLLRHQLAAKRVDRLFNSGAAGA